ncbi:MAG TPA: hypothetical protein P5080_00625 [Candidatus Paceibacterota bacterium]|nr:hypothetical protein [Candidatus Paceibacterota bacterium]
MEYEGFQQLVPDTAREIERRLMVSGYVKKVPLEMIAQKAISETTKIFHKKDGRRNLLISYESEKINSDFDGIAYFSEVATSVLYTVLPPRSGYRRCLIYNHGRQILDYQDLAVNGCEGNQYEKTDSVQVPGTQTLFVFNYPCELIDAIIMAIREHERQVKDRALAEKREAKKKRAQLTLKQFFP